MSASLYELKTQFLEYIEIERGRAIKTVENYDHYLTRFFKQTGVKEPGDITEEKVREFRLWLNRQMTRDGTTMKKRTQNYYLIALRAFLKFLRKRKLASLSPELIELAKVPQRELDLITDLELGRLLDAPEGDSIASLRDRAIMELFFSTGLRVSELTSLDRDLDLTRDEFSVRGKGDKVRVVFLSADAKEAIKKYVAARKDMDEPLFAQLASKSGTTQGKSLRLTPRSIERIVKKYAIKAGITRKVTPHVVRHSFATDLLQNGADIRSVQALLGHANIATTQVYTHVTDAHLKSIHQQFHGKRRK
jgi:site-specific recombinase XerD